MPDFDDTTDSTAFRNLLFDGLAESSRADRAEDHADAWRGRAVALAIVAAVEFVALAWAVLA